MLMWTCLARRRHTDRPQRCSPGRASRSSTRVKNFGSGTGAPVTLPATSAGIAPVRFLNERCCRIFEYFRRPPMVLKNVFPAMLCAALLAWSGLAVAEEYRPDQFLSLDLPGALLSPKPLGPASRF